MGGSVASALSHYVEYAALRGMVAALDRVGIRAAARFADRIGMLGYSPFGIRRAVVERQLAAAFPEKRRDEIARIAKASYANLARTTIETALLPSRSRSEILDMFERVDGWDVVQERLARGKGLMLLTGHLGNWELGGAYVAARGVALDVVARHMANPLVDRYLTRTREQVGMHVVHDEHAVRRVPRALREGGVVAFLTDQGAAGLASTWVPFFGRQAKTARGPAVFALRLGTPMVFAAIIRLSSGRYHFTFDTELTGDRETDIDRIVTAYTAVLEGWVRRVPEQYFWHHRRWKHQRPGTPSELGDPL
jgi:KDO2-lipid IV(A) lauroyltransferase